MVRPLIVTNGDSAAELMRAVGFDEEILPWRDVLHEGPVPALPPEELNARRAQHLTRYGSAEAATIAADMSARDATLLDRCRVAPVALWFEPDLYDQLQLVQVLALLRQARPKNLSLVQADTHLSTYDPTTIGALRQISRPVAETDLDYAQTIWAAFTSPEPTGLMPYTQSLAPLAYAPGAIRRLIGEYPDSKTGLGQTETAILNCLTDSGTRAGKVFRRIGAMETFAFLGDLSFAQILDTLVFAPSPLIRGLTEPLPLFVGRPPDEAPYRAYFASELSLTDAGRAVLNGAERHTDLNGIDRWIGGTHLTPANLWFRESIGDQPETLRRN
ncbi:MAG: DUF1835 domain-containing protein [Pseudomonadota bacterium]